MKRAVMPRIACLWIPHFVAQMEGFAYQIGEGAWLVSQDGWVAEVSPEAAARGVRAGQPVALALARCPDARIVETSLVHHLSIWEHVVDRMAAFSSAVEPERLGILYMEARGFGRLYGGETAWCQAIRDDLRAHCNLVGQIGVAGGKFTAQTASRTPDSGLGFQVVEQPDRAYLASLVVEQLPLSDEAMRRLVLLGIRTLGQFARLSSTAVAEQLGPECILAHRWASGRDDRPLLGRQRQQVESSLDFDPPASQQELLHTAATRLGRRLLVVLTRERLAASRLDFTLRLAEGLLWERTVTLSETFGAEKLSDMLGEILAGLSGESAGVVEMRLRLGGLGSAKGLQLDLFSHTDGRLRLAETLQEVGRHRGAASVWQCCPVDTESRLVVDRYRLEEYCP
jgi:protein ImuB